MKERETSWTCEASLVVASGSNLLPRYFLYGDNDPDTGLDTLDVEQIRERSSRHDWTIHPHMHPSHAQLLLFTDGGATIQIESAVFEARAGSLVVHPAGMVHGIRYQPGTEGLTITVSSSYVEALVRDDVKLSTGLQVAGAYELGPAGMKSGIEAAFQSMLVESQRRDLGWRMAVRGHFLTVLVALFRVAQHIDQPKAGSRDRELAMGLRALIEQHFREQKRMTFYADKLAVSPQRLNAACNSALGSTASDILYDRLMTEACRNLAYSEMTVAEIGHELGFDDPAYFNRFFAKRAQIPPGSWRAAFAATRRASDT